MNNYMQGMTVFRMKRNDSFIAEMLGMVSLFFTSCVQPRRLPPDDMLLGKPGYSDFLKHVQSLARQSHRIMHVSDPAIAEGSDLRPFHSERL